MLDKRSKFMLEVILKLCGEDGAYKIIEVAELERGMMSKYKISSDEISHMMKFLSATEMIDVKHSDDNVYCLTVLPRGRVYEEEQQQVVQNKTISKGMAFLIIFGSFLAAIVGAVIASVIIAVSS